MEELRIAPEDWPQAVRRVDGPQIVVGGPGTGKTEFLVRRAAHLIDARGLASERLLVLSFSRRAVADLDSRIHALLTASSSQVPTATFHGFAAALIETHAAHTDWQRPPMLLTSPEQTALIRELLSDDPPANWSPAFRSMLGSATFAAELTDFALRSTEQLLQPAEIERMAAQRDDWRGIAPFLERYRSELIARGRIDYGLLLFEATKLLDTSGVDMSGYDYVLVDEYQDTTLAQSRLIHALTRSAHNVAAAADPYQSIYSFRGARVANVAAFADEMAHADGPPPLRIVLTTSFRTPRRILEAAERITSSAIPGAAGPVEPTPHDGDVTVHVFDQRTAEAEWIASEIERNHLVDHIPFRDVAVFVRTSRRFVAELSRALERRDIPHETPTDRLAENPTVRFVLDVVTAATSRGVEQDRAIRSLLVGPSLQLTLSDARSLDRRRRSEGIEWPQAMAQIDRSGITDLVDMLVDGSWATESPASNGLWALWLVATQLTDVVAGDDCHDDRRAWSSLMQVIGRWNDRNPDGTLVDYQRLLASADFEARPLLSYRPAEHDQLTVTTMHQAKGLEFEIVFIADAIDGVLPDLRTRDSLLGVRHLLPDVPTDGAGYRLFRLQEERRLAYTAMTRARSRVVWTATTTGVELGQGAPSRFLPLLAGVATVEEAATDVDTDRLPVTPSEAETVLRRVLGDPALPRLQRLAALDVLTRAPSWGLRPIDTYAGIRPPGPSTGLVEPGLTLSATQADAYDRCPRRYAMERRLGIGVGETSHLVFGRLIHSVLEAAAKDSAEHGHPQPTRDSVMEQLVIQFDGHEFGGPPYADAWLRRAALTLEAYLEKRPRTGRIVAAEQPIELEIGERRWRGVIDAVIDHGDRQLQVVDYKTGTSIATIDEASRSLQLGLYTLGIGGDPDLRRIGTPRTAEYWYLYKSADSKNLSTRSFDMANLEDVTERLEEIATGIANEDWTPRPGEHCDRCPVRQSCPSQSAAAEGFVA